MQNNNNNNENALREFYSIALSKDLSFVEQVAKVLKLGCEYLQLKCGIVSYVEGDRYTVLHVYTNSDQYQIQSGDVFELGLTYCKFTLENNGPLGFNHVAISEIAYHPSYEALKLEAYIGAPTFLNNEVFGTINFSSIEPREEEFDDSEKYFVQLVSEWLSTQLDLNFKRESTLESYQEIAARLESVPLVGIELSANFEVLKWSDSATALLGWREEQVMNKSPRDWPLVGSADVSRLVAVLDNVRGCDDQGCAFYCDIKKNDGEVISTEWFLSSMQPIQGEDKRVHAQILDITNRVRSENELLRKNALYIDLFENAPDMYLSLDQAGNILSANNLCHRALGYLKNSLVGKPYWNLIYKEDVRRIRRLIDVAFLGDVEELEMEASLLTKDGVIIRTHQRIRIIQAKRGMPRELRVIARDITERKKGQVNRMLHLEQQRDEISLEVQHRIKNSLQAVIGLLTVNMDAHPELKPLLTNSVAQVNAISIVNSLILDGKEDVDFVYLLENLLSESSRLFAQEIKLDKNMNEISKIMLIKEEIISVSLILTELIINSLKHHRENTLKENYVHVNLEANTECVKVNISNTVSTQRDEEVNMIHLGQSMVNSLLPPNGAELNVVEDENVYQVYLTLMEPVINHV